MPREVARRAARGLARMAACLVASLFLSLPMAAVAAQTTPIPADPLPAATARQDSVWAGQAARPSASGLAFVTQQYPPFNYLERDEGTERVAGPVAEIIAMACERMGVGCTFRLLPWARALQEVRNGTADGIFTIGLVPERQQWLHFCPPLLRAEYGFFVRMENPLRYVTPRDVSGYRVGVYGPSLTADILEQLARQVPMTVDVAPEIDAGFLKLAQGRIDAVFSNRENGLATIALLRIANLRYAGWHNRVDYTVAFSRQTAPEVVQAFEAALLALHREGELQRCLARYGLQSTYPDVRNGKGR
ncbi:substrate-binding periplasmic protein [Nitratidesulfovibrio termitidis]|uniref:substrate-binding periplasmic protein n=1 Tax=Nitratidesulfovibrio termitidis TaxID=42252 RepID=UPI001FDF24C5|nr:transporter substrate-binding domain-containing protein [Nitratidesulfovibrio termitidis]